MTRNVTVAWLVASALGGSLSACHSLGVSEGTPGAARDAAAPGTPAPANTSQAVQGQPDAGNANQAIQNCAELGQRACSGLDQCAPLLMQAYYGNQATCQNLFSRICETLNAEGTAVDFARCSTALGSCGSFTEHLGVPRWCWVPRGQSAMGGACLQDTDCAEGMCQILKGDVSGACTAPAKAGEYCGPARCAVGLRCRASDGTCVTPLADGAACQSSLDCQTGSLCNTSGVCAPTEVGDPCTDGVQPCNAGRGQWCVAGQCSAKSWADGSHSCLSGGVECAGTDRCAIKQRNALERTGQCVAAADLGAACSAAAPCIEPLSCRAGTCRP
jgi:hypothetical protein